jgi:hypothetical protein
MEAPIAKEKILEAIQELPDDATVEDAIERLCFLAKVQRGLQQADRNESISHREIKLRWLS